MVCLYPVNKRVQRLHIVEIKEEKYETECHIAAAVKMLGAKWKSVANFNFPGT